MRDSDRTTHDARSEFLWKLVMCIPHSIFMYGALQFPVDISETGDLSLLVSSKALLVGIAWAAAFVD